MFECPSVTNHHALLPALLCTLLTTCLTSPARSATFDVAGADTAALIDAINAANATPDADTINLGAGTFTLSTPDNSSSGPNGLPSIVTEITINGASLDAAGMLTTVLERDPAAQPFRVLHVAGTGLLRLNRVEVRNGSVDGLFEDFSPACFDPCGGGLLVEEGGSAWLNTSRLTDNNGGETGGGGAYNHGTLNFVNSVVTGGRTLTSGGAFINGRTGTLNIVRSLVTGNRADEHGGAISNSGTLRMDNSTVSGNRTSDGRPTGGGLSNFGTAALTFTTFVDNIGAGIVNEGEDVTLRSSVLAGNVDGEAGLDGEPDPPLDCIGPLVSEGHNLIGTDEFCRIDDSAAPGTDQVGSAAAPLDPLLGPLQDNSGANGVPPTHAPLPGSPLVDAATPRQPLLRVLLRTTDQRGYVRLAGVEDDVGAHEAGAPPGCAISTLDFRGGSTVDLLLLFLFSSPRPATIVGGPGDDVLEGTPGPDVIVGLGGNDRIRGLFGDDIICGGPGDDRLLGNGGADDLFGDDGDDRIFGGSMDDEMEGGPGTDLCNGGAHASGDLQASCETVLRVP